MTFLRKQQTSVVLATDTIVTTIASQSLHNEVVIRGDSSGSVTTRSPIIPEHQQTTNSERFQPPKLFYWNSQAACNFFGVKLERPEDNVRDVLRPSNCNLQVKIIMAGKLLLRVKTLTTSARGLTSFQYEADP